MVTHSRTPRKQRGIVLLLALVALLLISAVGAAILYMTATESALVGYQRSNTRAYEGALGGLDEGRARLSTSDPSFIGTATFSIDFPAALGDVLYILSPRPAGEFVIGDVTAAGTPYSDWEYDREWGAGALAAATIQNVNSDMIPLAALVTLPEIPYKWVRVTILTEQAANRDIDGDGVLDNTIPVTWDSRSNRMNINVNPAAQVDREGDGLLEPLDTDLDGTVEVRERLGRYVYRVTALSLVPVTGATRLVQYDVSSPMISLNFPAAVSLIGPTSTCGPTLGCDSSVMGTCDSPATWGPSNALTSQGDDQNPAAPPGEGGPAIGCTDPATCDDCTNEIDNLMRSDNWSGVCSAGDPGCDCDDADPDTACTGDITATAGPLGNTTGLQLMVNAIRAIADQTFTAGDTPPQTDGNPANDVIAWGGGDLGSCNGTNQPKVTVFDGDVDLGSDTGCGILLVTGSLAVSGSWEWKGIVLVVGEGSFDASGTPSMQGAQVLARMYCQDGDPAPCPCTAPPPIPNANCAAPGVLAEPAGGQFIFNGGGSDGWDYNSMYIDNAAGSGSYRVLAYREMTQ